MNIEFDIMRFLARLSDAMVVTSFYLRTFDEKLEGLTSEDLYTLRIAIGTETPKEVTIDGTAYVIKPRWEKESKGVFGVHIKLEEVTK